MNRFGYIGIGSNLGNRIDNIYNSILEINSYKSLSIIKLSNIYETNPMYKIDQNKFLNLVIKFKTSLNPVDLLNALQEIEFKIGRPKSRIKNSSRIIDLDILTYDNQIINRENLKIPHPKISERPFVLIPIYEIDNCFTIPGDKRNIKTIIDSINKNDVKLNKVINLEDVKTLPYSN